MNLLILAAALALQDSPFKESDPLSAQVAAQEKARAENRRVLLLWGTAESEPARAAAALFKSDKAVKKVLLYEYDVVMADAGQTEAAKRLGADVSKLPWMTILAPDGAVLFNEAAPGEAKSLLGTLEKHKASPWVAKDILAAGLKKAAAEKKRVLLTFGAPW